MQFTGSPFVVNESRTEIFFTLDTYIFFSSSFAVGAPENDGNDLLLTDGFLKNILDVFSLPKRGTGTAVKSFPVKFLNVMDPLKENNNLGRSVSQGIFIFYTSEVGNFLGGCTCYVLDLWFVKIESFVGFVNHFFPSYSLIILQI